MSLELITPPFVHGGLGWMMRGLGTFETSSHNSIYYMRRGMITQFCSCRKRQRIHCLLCPGS